MKRLSSSASVSDWVQCCEEKADDDWDEAGDRGRAIPANRADELSVLMNILVGSKTAVKDEREFAFFRLCPLNDKIVIKR